MKYITNKKNIYLLSLPLIFIFYYLIRQYTNIHIPCIFNEITHLLCASCGVTRMLDAIINLDFIRAFNYNKLLFISMPIFIVLYIDIFIKNGNNKEPLIYKIPRKIYYLYIIILVLFMIVRNIL